MSFTGDFSRPQAVQRGSGISARWNRQIAQPKMMFAGVDLYPTLVEKAAALGFALVESHPFVDGNKRVGHAAMETFLILNGAELDADVGDQEALILGLAAGRVDRGQLVDWLRQHLKPLA